MGVRVAKIKRGSRNIAWIESHCRIPEGKLVGQPVRLTKIQKKWIKEIYDTPTRTFILSIARKNAKTSFSAFLLLLHLCGPEAKPNSQLYSAAQSRSYCSKTATTPDYASRRQSGERIRVCFYPRYQTG